MNDDKRLYHLNMKPLDKPVYRPKMGAYVAGGVLWAISIALFIGIWWWWL
jgi:hypothetical protein